MISFQWITLSFLLVSSALFAYLIPHGETYLCNDGLLDERHSAGNSVKNVGTQIYDHDSDLCQGDKPNDR